MAGKRRKRAYHRKSLAVWQPAFFLSGRLARKPRLRMHYSASPDGQPAWKAWLKDKTTGRGEPMRFWAFTISVTDKFKENLPWKATLTMALQRPSFECKAAAATECHHARLDPRGTHFIEEGLPADYISSFLKFFRIELDDPPDINEESINGMTAAYCKAFAGVKRSSERDVIEWARTQRGVDLKATKTMREMLAQRAKEVS